MSLWNTRPLNQVGSNAFGQNPDGEGEERLTADSLKCPSCGSNITYEPELGSMLCRNCGNVYSAAMMEPLGSFGISKEHDYMGDGDMSDEDKKRHEIVCNSCGAALITDENTMSTICPFCGSPALITQRMSREFKPDYIVPFKIDKDEAKKITIDRAKQSCISDLETKARATADQIKSVVMKMCNEKEKGFDLTNG